MNESGVNYTLFVKANASEHKSFCLRKYIFIRSSYALTD